MLNIKKIFATVLLVSMTLTSLPLTTVKAAVADQSVAAGVYLGISAPSASSVKEGGSISYTLTYDGADAIMNLTAGHVGLVGFTGNKTIKSIGNRQYLVTISNIKNVAGSEAEKRITVNGGTAISKVNSSLANGVKSHYFTIKAADVAPVAPVETADTQKPVLTISAPSANEIVEGGSVVFTLKYTDDKGINSINLTRGHIGLKGFEGDVAISGTGLAQRTVTISNIKNVGENKYITVNGGTAIDTAGKLADGKQSAAFKIVKAAVDQKPVLTISAPSANEIVEGGKVVFTLKYTDDKGIKAINLTKGHIGLKGFEGDVAISGTGLAERTVTISNIKNVGENKYITVNGGTAIDTAGNLADGKQSAAFKIVKATVDQKPVLTISAPSAKEVVEGGKVVFTLKYTDDKGIKAINLTKGHIGLKGFEGDVAISGTGLAERTVTISNIKNVGENKYITVNGGTAIDTAGNLADGQKSEAFKIVKATVDQKPVLTISAPSAKEVVEGGSVAFTLKYTDDKGIKMINLTNGHIGLVGFTGDVKISGTGLAERTVVISNIKNVGDGKYITVNGGTAIDTAGNLADGQKSSTFKVTKKVVEDNKPAQEKPADWVPNPNTGRE